MPIVRKGKLQSNLTFLAKDLRLCWLIIVRKLHTLGMHALQPEQGAAVRIRTNYTPLAFPRSVL